MAAETNQPVFFPTKRAEPKLDVKKPWASKRHSSLQDNSSRCFLLCILNAQKRHGHAMRLVRNSSLNGNGMVNLEEDSRNYWHQHWLLVKASGGNRLREYWKINYNIICIYIYKELGVLLIEGHCGRLHWITHISWHQRWKTSHMKYMRQSDTASLSFSLSLYLKYYVGWRFSIWWLIQLNSIQLIIATDPFITLTPLQLKVLSMAKLAQRLPQRTVT